MARAESSARRACKQEACSTGPAARRSDVGLERSSAELRRRVRHQQASVGGCDGSRQRRRGARCADYAGHIPYSVGYDHSYDPDNEMSSSDSLEKSSTCSDDESVSRRKKMQEDALFGFFKKENKRLKATGLGRDAYSVYATKYFAEILKRMAIGRKNVISKYGFEHLLKFEKTELPSHFTRWIVGCVDTISSQIIIDDQKIIFLSKESVHLVLGLPNSGVVAMPNKERGRSFIMSRFNLSEIPNVTFFGNMLTSEEDLSDEDTFICFMVIVMSCFLFPSSNDHIHTDFLFLPEDPTVTRGFDMCLLVYQWILAGINQYVLFGRETGRKPKAFDFWIYCLAVLYLDKLDFGVKVVEQGTPRILAWKGNLIKHFSELDRKKSNLFGRRPFKKEHLFATEMGARHGIIQQGSMSVSFKEEMLSSYANVLHGQIIQGIIGSAHCDKINESGFQNVQEAIASNVLKFLSGPGVSSLFNAGGQGTLSKLGSLAKQKMGISSEDDRTHKKGLREYGESSDVNEKLKHVKSNISRTTVKINENMVSSIAASKHSDTGTSNNKLPLQPVVENSLSLVHKDSHDALATPECAITKIVEHSNEKVPEVEVVKKVRARVFNTMHREQEFSLINTFPAGLKERNSFLQFSVQHSQGTFTRSISLTGTKKDVGGQIAPPEAGQSNYQMINHMSPIGRTKLFSEDCNIGTSNNPPKLMALADKFSKTSQIIGTKQAPIPVADLSPSMPTKRKADIVDISPTSFGVRQIELAKNADLVYNNLIGLIAKRQCQSTVGVEEVVDVPDDTDNHIIIDELAPDTVLNQGGHDNLIILRPKSLLELPIEENEKFPVSNEECMHYNSIIELAYTKRIQRNYALTYSMVHCNYVSLGQSLMPTGHIDNFLIPCFCRKFFEDHHPSISGRHHFFPNIGEYILNYPKDDKLRSIATSFLGAGSASRGKRLDLSNTLFFPTCLDNHWIVFAVNFKWKLFAFLDSFYDKDSYLHKSIREKFINNFIKLWEIISQTDQHNFKIFKRMYPHVPKQINGNDCGVFATKIMEIWDPTLDLCKIFSHEDIQHIRIQYMNQLFFCKKNTADKSLVTGFNLQG
ncbi:uncharacterized protein [Triticum aestivum]|uniref:uncharacterized protein isoform X2 n=1 Tax=Triticum aestivum TaxID=4565 RepID=UPI001D0117EF|nr:uncharacterized protein LOC123140031 isoform X2 [Triticum aestivum]